MINDKKNHPDADQEMNAEISETERSLLDESIENSISVDNDNLKRSVLDNVDEEGDLLNGATLQPDLTGEYLYIPGSELDNANEDIGEEDEENNNYSQADTE
jgi:hypothetical protein